MTIWLGICFTMLIVLPPIGLIMLGLFFPIYIAVMIPYVVFVIVRTAIRN
jgi:hypothetical protein